MSQELVHPYLVHPRTGEPLRAVGVVRGRPVWPIMGGDGSEADANDDTGDQDQDTDDQDQDRDDQDRDQDRDDDDTRVRRANRQAQNYRTQLREQEQRTTQVEQELSQTREVLTRLQRAITGEDGDDSDGDPAEQVTELTSQVERLTSENQQLQSAVLVHNLAADAGANANALLDSRSFTNQLAELDASAEDYRTQVLETMREAVSKNAAYAAGQGSGRGGSELDKGNREQQTKRPKGLGSAIGAHYGK